MIIRNNKSFLYVILLITNSCSSFGYYRLNSDEKIINILQDSTFCIIPSVEIENDNVYQLLDSIIGCNDFSQNKKKVYQNLIIKEINSYLIIQKERSCKEKIEKCWGGFFYKGWFVCIPEPMINKDNQVFKMQNCNVRVQGLLKTCSGYSEVPYSALFAKKQKDTFLIKYKTCEYILSFDDEKQRTNILLNSK